MTKEKLAVRCTLALSGLTLIAQTHNALAQNAAVSISIDTTVNRKPINPNIYGIAYGTTAILNDLNAPVNRLGGNNISRYNWQLNADNKGSDYYFESIGDPSAVAGERGDTFIAATKAAGAQPMLTIPMIGWVAKLGANRSKLDSFSIAKYGAQTGSDWQWFSDAGNGIRNITGQPYVTGNDPNDANVAVNSTYQQGWVAHLYTKWGAAANGGLKYYLMDNEPSIWQSTHRDVHPVGPTMDEIKNDILDYGGKVKAIDPTALVVGPEEWGWSGYLYSGYDQQYGSTHNWTFPDRANHGGMDYLPYLLDQLRQNNAATGKRLLDVFSVHYYPQGGEFSNDTSTNMQLLRNRSTRSLWDPNYVDQTWIGTQVKLIPRLKDWVNTYYPGTQTAITEYNWGAEGHINGATTQADIFGIFGREGLDFATRWTTPAVGSPTYNAMKLYRNYDGSKSGFGDTSVSDTVPNPDALSSFASVRSSDGALTIMVISKVLSGNTPITLNLRNFNGNGTVQVWQLTAGTTIQRGSDLTLSAGTLTTSVPPQSISLYVLPASSVPVKIPAAPTRLTALAGNAQVSLAWTASPGATGYRVLRSLALSGPYVVTATTTANAFIDMSVTGGTTYFYQVTTVNTAGASAPSNTASAAPSGISDSAQYNFEAGTQGWVGSGGMITGVSTSTAQVFKGAHSLAVSFKGTVGGTQSVSLASPNAPAGATVTYHIWLPVGSPITAIQPYVQQGGSGGWVWTGNWRAASSLTAGAWNTITVVIPANAATPLYQMGVQFTTNAAWTGTCYLDTVNW